MKELSEKGELTLVFQGEISREALSNVLSEILKRRKMTIREAAAGVGKITIQKIKSCDSTIDLSLKVLSSLGVSTITQVYHSEAQDPMPSEP